MTAMTMLDLNRFPVDRDIHTLADFAELLVMVNLDRLLTRDQFEDHLCDAQVENRKAAIDTDTLNDVYAQLAWRESAFGADYPFQLMHRGLALAYEPGTRSDRYTYLLLCANLPLLTVTHNPWTNGFERFAAQALHTWWSLPGEVRPFGKGLSDFEGKKWERMNQLAHFLGGEGLYSEASFRPKDQGDGGVDIAARRTFDNYEHRNMLTALVQCACSRSDWPSKQGEASTVSLNKLHVSPDWLVVMCIPQCFRDNHGRWAFDSEPGKVILLDRLRLLQLLPASFELSSISPPPDMAVWVGAVQ